MHTCANEHDVILPILRLHSVHHYLGELVFHVGLDDDWPVVDWVDGVEHGRVSPRKGDDLVWKIFRRIETTESFTGALRKQKIIVQQSK